MAAKQRVQYAVCSGIDVDADVIATYRDRHDRLWVAIWELIRNEPIWLCPDQIERIYDD